MSFEVNFPLLFGIFTITFMGIFIVTIGLVVLDKTTEMGLNKEFCKSVEMEYNGNGKNSNSIECKKIENGQAEIKTFLRENGEYYEVKEND